MEVWTLVLIIVGIIFFISVCGLLIANGCVKLISKPLRSEKQFVVCVEHAQLDIEQLRQLREA